MPDSVIQLPIERWCDGVSQACSDEIAVEEALEIRLGWGEPTSREARTVAITMRTPGDDFDLAIGFLFAEGIIEGVAGIVRCRVLSQASLQLELHPDVAPFLQRLERDFITTSACGVCGKRSTESAAVVQPRPNHTSKHTFDSTTLPTLPQKLREAQTAFQQTGGLHAAALFSSEGELLIVREDVGRHNAVDKLVGSALRQGLDLADKAVMVSGRISYELASKCVTAGVPLLCAIGAPSSLAIDVADQFDLTLVGFLRADRFNIYTSAWRLPEP